MNSIYSCRWTKKNSSLVKYNKPISTEILKFFKILEMLKSGPLIWIKLIVWLSAYLPVSDIHVIMTKILPFYDLVLLIADHEWKMFFVIISRSIKIKRKEICYKHAYLMSWPSIWYLSIGNCYHSELTSYVFKSDESMILFLSIFYQWL